MNIQVHHVIVHTPEQVREIIAEAGRIADAAVVDEGKWRLVFEQACTLLGQRHSIAMMPQAPPVDLGVLGLNHKRNR